MTTPHAEFHTLIWISSIIGSIGGAVGIGIGALRFIGKAWDRAALVVSQIGETRQAVETIKTNHLEHLSQSVNELCRSNAEIVDLTKDVRDGIIKLVARSDVGRGA